MCPSPLPLCFKRKKSVCFSMLHWHRQSCIPMHIPNSRPYRLHKKKKHGPPSLFQGLTNHPPTQMYRVTCIVTPMVFHSSAFHTGRLLRQSILLSSTEKNEGGNFLVVVLSVTLCLFGPKWATALSRSLLPSTPFYLCLRKVDSREGAFPETR